MGSLFYAIVCITTIGYGDQTPKTILGKLSNIHLQTISQIYTNQILHRKNHHHFVFNSWNPNHGFVLVQHWASHGSMC